MQGWRGVLRDACKIKQDLRYCGMLSFQVEHCFRLSISKMVNLFIREAFFNLDIQCAQCFSANLFHMSCDSMCSGGTLVVMTLAVDQRE